MVNKKRIIGALMCVLVGVLLGVIASEIGGLGSNVVVAKEKVVVKSDSIEVGSIFDKEYYQNVHELLESSNRSIHVTMYEVFYYNSSNNVDRIITDLANARKRGVEVKIVIEGGSAWLGKDFIEKNTRAYNYLKSGGVDVRFDEENITTHTKLIIVDESVVVVGSTNWGYSSLEYNHEANAIIRSREVALQFEKYFDEIWEKSR